MNTIWVAIGILILIRSYVGYASYKYGQYVNKLVEMDTAQSNYKKGYEIG